MINTSVIRELEFRIEDCIRSYHKSVSRYNAASKEISEAVLSNKTPNEKIISQAQDAKWEMEYFPKRLEELKQEYIRLVSAISL